MMDIGYYEFTVPREDSGITLKTFLRRKCDLSARSMTVIKHGGGSIRCGERELRAHDILNGGEAIRVCLPREESEIPPMKGSLDILYEDRCLMIVNKSALMPVHPTKSHQLDTLANIVSYYQQSKGESYIFRALNRLDKDTSGCVILAKDRIAYRLVFPTVQKTYYAFCDGIITQNGTVNAPIGTVGNNGIKRCIREDGAEAVTHYEPLVNGKQHTLLRLRLETGRTHQIRCHMSAMGHPLTGDLLYGGSTDLIHRQALHCRFVTLRHPITDKAICVEAPFPEDFSILLQTAFR